MKNTFFKKTHLLIPVALFIVSQVTVAHTRLQNPQVDEGSRNYNHQVIAHGCRTPDPERIGINTLGTVVVFPDGEDSTITVNGEVSDKPLTDFVTNWGNPISKIQSKNVFDFEDEIKTPAGNVIGYWTGGSPELTSGLTGLIPFRTSSVSFKPESCAKSIKFIVAIADICQLTKKADFSDASVMLWTPNVGSNFDGTEDLNGYNSPASFTVNRTETPLVAVCGEGEEVVVTPSAAQLNRDMPILIDGSQIWPVP